MSHTYIANFVHCVFATKQRQELIPAEFQPKLCAYLIGVARNLNITMVAVGGTPNHVHILIAPPSAMALAVAVQKLKANSSCWLGEQGLNFEWQKGYGAFSVSASLVENVKNYICNQEQHHRKRTFEEEFVALLNKSGVAHDVKELFAA